MSRDLELQLSEMGPEYAAVVGRLKSSRWVEPSGRVAVRRRVRVGQGRGAVGWLMAASLVVAVGLAAVTAYRNRGGAGEVRAAHEYVMSVDEIIASQNVDGSWQNDFLTRRNADRLRGSAGLPAQIAYKKAMRNLRSRGVL